MENTEKLKKYEKAIIDFPDVNRVVIAGDLIFDPPLRWTKRGVPVTNFVISTTPDPNIEEPDELRTKKCFINVVVWAQKAVFCHENLRKGTPVLIIGELQSMPNFAPEKAYYPVQLNAKWIQVLERNKARKPITILDQKELITESPPKSIAAEEEVPQAQDTIVSGETSEALPTDIDSKGTVEVGEELSQPQDSVTSESHDIGEPMQTEADSIETAKVKEELSQPQDTESSESGDTIEPLQSVGDSIEAAEAREEHSQPQDTVSTESRDTGKALQTEGDSIEAAAVKEETTQSQETVAIEFTDTVEPLQPAGDSTAPIEVMEETTQSQGPVIPESRETTEPEQPQNTASSENSNTSKPLKLQNDSPKTN